MLAEAAELITEKANPVFAEIRLNFGRATCETGATKEGLALIREGRAALPAVYGEDHWYYGVADEFEARCQLAAGEHSKAVELGEKAYRQLQGSLSDEHFFTKRAGSFLAKARMLAQR